MVQLTQDCLWDQHTLVEYPQKIDLFDEDKMIERSGIGYYNHSIMPAGGFPLKPVASFRGPLPGHSGRKHSPKPDDL